MASSDHSVSITAEELRGIITGETPFRKCPSCGGSGTEWTLHYSCQEDPGPELQRPVDAQFAADYRVEDYPEHSYGECYEHDCETCHSVGFISSEIDF